jgi:MFS family permease
VEESEPPDNRFPRELVRVLVVASSWGFAFSSSYLLPKFFAADLNASPAEIGNAIGIFGWATVALAAHTGRLVDRWTLRRVMVLGTLGTAITSFGLASVTSVGPLLYGIRVAQAYSHALCFTAVGVAVARISPPERLSQALGLSGASMLVMNALAPAILEPIADHYGWPYAFSLAGFAALVSCALASRLRAAQVSATRSSTFLEVLTQPIGRDFALIAAIAGLAWGSMVTFEPPLALALGKTQVRGFFVAYAVGAITVRLGLGHLPDRVGRYRTALATFVVYTFVVLSLAVAPVELFELSGLVFGVSHGLFYPSLNAIAVTNVEPHQRGRILAVFTGAFYLGFAGTTVLGPLADAFGYRSVFWAVGVTTGCGVLLLARSKAFGAKPSTRLSLPVRLGSAT